MKWWRAAIAVALVVGALGSAAGAEAAGGSGTIKGVVSFEGSPVSGANVQLMGGPDANELRGFVITQVDGSFEAEVAPGRYRLCVGSPEALGLGIECSDNGSGNSGSVWDGTVYTVAAGATTTVAFAFQPKRAVSGRLVTTAGVPLPDVVVSAYRPGVVVDSPNRIRELVSADAMTGPDGRFELELTPREYRIYAQPSVPASAGPPYCGAAHGVAGCVSYQGAASGAPVVVTGTGVDVGDIAVTRFGSWTMTAIGTRQKGTGPVFSGSEVYRCAAGTCQPFSTDACNLSATTPGWSSSQGLCSRAFDAADTSGPGGFSGGVLPPGSYAFLVFPAFLSQGSPRWYGGATSLAHATVVTLGEGQKARLRTVLGVPVRSMKAPVAAGKAKAGRKLRARIGVPPGLTATYQWLRGKKPIRRANAPSYRLKAADRGRKIRVKVVLHAPSGATVVRMSKPRAIR